MALWGGSTVDTEGEFLGLQIVAKCIFQGFFLEFSGFIGSFEENLTRKIHRTFLYACLLVSKPKSKKNKWMEWKIFQGFYKSKRKKTHEEIEFYNSIQDRVFTTAYQL